MANKLLNLIKKLYHDVKTVIHGKSIDSHSDSHLNLLQKFIHFWVLSWRGFVHTRCPARASALAYTTMLALIPMLAVVASVSTSLLKSKGEEPIKLMIEQIVQKVAPQLDLVPSEEGETSGQQKVVATITDSISNISSGKLGATGMLGLVFVAIMLLATIEATFNDIWGVTHGRRWLARIIQYWATVTLGPLIPVVAVALNATAQFEAVETQLAKMPFVGQFLVSLVPFVVLSVAFALLYQLMPNTRVRWQASLVGGLVGGSLWQLNSLFSIIYASRVVTYTNIYGPLSLVPVFLIGLYFSWLILLFGAQVAYTFQNRSALLQQRLAESVNELGREFVALRIMTLIGHRFSHGEHPPTAIEVGQLLAVPTRLIGEVVQSLVEANILVEVEGSETAYTVGRPMEKISCDNILQAVRQGQGRQLETTEDSVRQYLKNEFTRIQEAERSVSGQVTLSRLVQAAESGQEQPAST